MLTKSHLTYDKCQRIICFLRHVSNDSIKKHDDLNYFKQSILPTDHFQSSLPHLSIPKLDLTCQRYLTAVRPILNNDENSYEQTRQIVENFRRGDGKRLDAQLRQKIKMNKHTSYLSKPWFEMYLKSRLPLVLNFNVFFLFTDDQQQLKPAARITNYIVSSIRFMNSLRANWLDSGLYYLNSKRIKTDQFGKYFRYLPKLVSYYAAVLQKFYPLDMSQFNHLFNSTRIPKVNCDLLVTYTENIRHIIVIKRGHYYKVNILEQNGQLLPIEKIASIMKYLYEDLNEEENKYSLGYFTADKRERWALIRQQIEALSECNKQALKEIDSSIMIVCLDEDDPTKLHKSLTKKERAEYISGQYLCYNALNRWHDKPFNMVMLSDGTLGLHSEHSWGDGVTFVRFCNDINQDAYEYGRINSSNYSLIKSTAYDCIEEIKFKLDDKLKSDYEISKHNYNKLVSNLNLSIYQEEVLGKNLLKQFALSPDAIMQLGIQMAYYKIHHRFVSVYESCSTAVYKHGRTETIRSVTNETKNFIETLTTSNDKQLIKSLLKKCSEKHRQLIKEAATGQGFDRHLFALKYLQQIENQESQLHTIYTDKSYELMNHHILSTSTITSKYIAAIGFGPVIDNGFGVWYAINDNQCQLLVTSFMKQELSDFMQAVHESYKELANIIKA